MSAEATVKTGRSLGQWLRKWLHRGAVTSDFVQVADGLRLRDKLEEAEAVCRQGLVSLPDYASGHVLLGEILRARGQDEAAEVEWTEARRLHPEHPRANLHLAQLYLSRGEIARAMAALELSLLYSPGSQEADSLLRQVTRTEVGGQTDAPRTAWLTADRYGELLAAVSGCPSVRATALIAPNGELAGGELGSPEARQRVADLAATLMQESRHLLDRIGAGALRAVLIRGRRGDLQGFVVDEHVVLAALAPGTPVGLVRREMQGTMAALRRRWDDAGRKDALAPVG